MVENLTTEAYNSVLQAGHFVRSQGEVYCLKVTCDDCEHINKCKHVEAEKDKDLSELLHTHIRRSLSFAKAPKGEWVGDTTKIVLKTFKDMPFESADNILYDWTKDNYVCVSGTCLGCVHVDNCNPDIEVREADPVIWSSDLKAQEPRCYAMLSNEPNWTGLFQNDSIRSTKYLYEAISNLMDLILETETDLRYWVFLDKHFFEDRTDLYNLVSCLLMKDSPRFKILAEDLILLMAKDIADIRGKAEEVISNLEKHFQSQCDLILKTKVAFPPVGDFHAANAVAMFGLDEVQNAYFNDYSKFKDFYRDKAKKSGLALNYGGTSFMLRRVLDVSEPEADHVFDKYFKTLFVFKEYLDKAWKKALKNFYVTTMLGRRIYIWQLAITDRKRMWVKLGEGKNDVYNYPIQSSSAEMVRVMLIKAYTFCSKFKTTKYDINYVAKVTQNSKLMSIDSLSPKLAELSEFIDNAPLGNVRLVVINDAGEVVQQSSRSIGIRWKEAEYFNLQEVL